MSTEIKVPDLGHDDAVEVIEVLIEAGQQVAKDDPLITIESDKATFEVPAEEAGEITNVSVSLGDEVKTGDVIAEFEPGDADGDSDAEQEAPDSEGSDEKESEDDEQGNKEKEDKKSDQDKVDQDKADQEESGQKKSDKDKSNKKKTEEDQSKQKDNKQKKQSSPKQSSYQPPEKRQSKQDNQTSVNASPQVRKAARELGVDLQYVPTGDNDRVSIADVQTFVREQFSAIDQAESGKDNPERYGDVERTPLSKVRAMTAAIMHKSWLEAPQVTHFDEVDISELEDYRKRHNLSFLPFLLKAVANTLEEFPLMRSSFDAVNAELVQKNYYRIGLAVDTEQGLLRPVLADVDSQSIPDIASSMKTLVEKTRAGRLAPTDQRGAVFTISSLGGMGGTQFTPIVNGPEVGILGVSKTQVKPVYQDGEFVPAMMLPLALSYDHRVIDGVYAAKFMNELKDRLETMAELLE